MTSYSYDIKIPQERVAVLIGINGDVKKRIEESTKTSLKIDSKEGDVRVSGDDALGLYTCREVVKSVGRGFNPDIACLLLKQDYALEIINVQEYAGKSKHTLERLRGRVIGREGKARKIIEELTETYVSVYGKTIAIIGMMDGVTMAKRAVESLLNGSTHASVYKWLEKRRRELKKKRMIDLT